MSRRLMAFGALLVMVPGTALAQAWPAKQPIKVVIPFSAGSATDVVPRAILEQVGKQIGQTFVVENRVGAGGTLGRARSRQGRARRIHAAGPFHHPCGHPVDLFEPGLRREARFCRHHVARQPAERAGGAAQQVQDA